MSTDTWQQSTPTLKPATNMWIWGHYLNVYTSTMKSISGLSVYTFPCIIIIIFLSTFIIKSQSQSTPSLPRPPNLQPQLSNQWSLLEIIPNNYNNQQPPMINRSPVDVEINLAIISFHKIDENSQSFISDVFLHQKWKDPRLRFPRLIRDVNSLNNQRNLIDVSPNFSRKIVLNNQWINRIWTPSINFRNSRAASVANSINPSIYITLDNNSNIFMAVKMSLDLNCNFNFANYPFDAQDCHIEITSRKFIRRLIHD